MAGEGGALREVFAKFGFEFDSKGLERGNQMVASAIKGIQTFGAALAGIAAVKYLKDFADGFAADVVQIRRGAAILGLSTDEFQQLGYAASRAGVDTQQFTFAMATLDRQTVASARGKGPAAQAFRTLGINVRDANGHLRSSPDIMADVAHNMGNVRDQAQRVALSTALFGRAGRMLVPILHDGAGGLEAYRQEFRELGGGYTERAMQASGQYRAAMARQTVVVNVLRSAFAERLLPAMVAVQEKVLRGLNAFRKMIEGTHLVEVALYAMGAAAGAAALNVAIANIPVIAMAAALLILGLAVDDIITAFEGGDSAIGHFIDDTYGVGSTAAVVHQLKEDWDKLVESVEHAIDATARFLHISPAQGGRGAFDAARQAQAMARAGGRPAPQLIAGALPRGTAPPVARVDDRIVRAEPVAHPLSFAGVPNAATASSTVTHRTTPSTVVHHHSTSIHAPITVHAAPGQSEREIATLVAHELAAAQEAAHDANHAVPGDAP